MVEIVNLNKHRKTKQRADKKRAADENSVKFGRTKGEKRVETLKADKAKRDLDGHERE